MKRFLCTLLIMALLLSLLSLPAFAEPTGTGTEEDPYLISSYDDIHALEQEEFKNTGAPAASVYYKLMNNLALDSHQNFYVLWKNMTIDLNGYTLSYDASSLFRIGVPIQGEYKIIPDSVTVKNGCLRASNITRGGYSLTELNPNADASMFPEGDDIMAAMLAQHEDTYATSNWSDHYTEISQAYTVFNFVNLSLDFSYAMLNYLPNATLNFFDCQSNDFMLVSNGAINMQECVFTADEGNNTIDHDGYSYSGDFYQGPFGLVNSFWGSLNATDSELTGPDAAVVLFGAEAGFRDVALRGGDKAIMSTYDFNLPTYNSVLDVSYNLDRTSYYYRGNTDNVLYEDTSYTSPSYTSPGGPVEDNPDQRQTNVTYTVEESGQFSPTYTVSIPAQVRLNEEFVISVDELILDNGSNLVVTLDNASTNQQGFALFGTGNNANNSINYTVKCLENRKGETASAADWANADIKEIGNQVLSYSGPCNTNDGDNVPPTLMRFELVEDLSYVPGDYEGYVTFGIAPVQN